MSRRQSEGINSDRMKWTQLVLILSLSIAARGVATASRVPGDPEDQEQNAEAHNAVQITSTNPDRVTWKPLLLQSLGFLAFEHSFRYLTEPGTRHPGHPFFQGYLDAVSNLHGWADGDPFYVNYVGHPMQGAVAGYLWIQNDPRFRNAQFGRNREYWKSRLRAGAFSWAYSTQMEIGPISEASLGGIQANQPQQGLVDHVITPAIGMGWLITEDIIDRKIIRSLEQKTDNRYVIAMLRGGLNPSRSLANVFGGRRPWARIEDPSVRFGAAPQTSYSTELRPGLPPFEVSTNAYALGHPNAICIGGGSTVAVRVHPHWQMVGELNGCNMTGQVTNWSGDSMSYMVGSRWTPITAGRWHPFLQVLGGGTKVTQELLFPERKALLEYKASVSGSPMPAQTEYTQQFDTEGWAVALGGGADFQINNAFSVRVLSIEYTRAWVYDLPRFAAPNGVQFKSGLVLRLGTW